MRLEERIASALRSRTELDEVWAPDLGSIRRTARRQARREAVVVAAGLVSVVAALMTVVGVQGGQRDRSVPAVDEPDGEVLTIPRRRDDLVVVSPTVRLTMSPGPRLAESLGSDDETYDDSGKLEARLEAGSAYSWEAWCDGAPQVFFVVLVEPEADFISTDRCEDATVSAQAEEAAGGTGATLRVFVTDEDPQAFRRCYEFSPPQGCDEVEPAPAAGSAARFGLTLHRVERSPAGVSMHGVDLPARAAWAGKLYSLATVAAGATGAQGLTYRVEAAEQQRIAQATLGYTPAFDRCVATRRFEQCQTVVELRVDGRPVADQAEGPFDGRAGWGRLTPGEAHEITLEVTRGNPRHVDLVVKIYEEER